MLLNQFVEKLFNLHFQVKKNLKPISIVRSEGERERMFVCVREREIDRE